MAKRRRRKRSTVKKGKTIKSAFKAVNQKGGTFMDKQWWTRFGKNLGNTAVEFTTLGMAPRPFK